MKLNWGERLAVNNPLRPLQQRCELAWMGKRVRLAPRSSVLEIGCGRGAGARLILRRFQPASLVIADLDQGMIGMAHRYLSAIERERIRTLVADAQRLPFVDSVFDAVFGFGVLHHLPDWRVGLEEIARVLKPDGLYLLEELYPSLYQNVITRRVLLHPGQDRFRGPDLRAGLSAAGLQLASSIEQPFLGILGICRKGSRLAT